MLYGRIDNTTLEVEKRKMFGNARLMYTNQYMSILLIMKFLRF